MESLTESQFHTVWTEAVGMEGYNKKLFQNLLAKMVTNGTVKKLSQPDVSGSLPDFAEWIRVHGWKPDSHKVWSRQIAGKPIEIVNSNQLVQQYRKEKGNDS